ncbi:MAG: cytidylyltransferase domain-containing protein [Puniceicoccales bacterium]
MNKSGKTVAIIVSRMGSSRLPGKALMEIGGEPMAGRIIERVGKSPSVDEILIATSTLPEDDPLEAFAKSRGVRCFRGSPDDVLGRITEAARFAEAETVLDLMGDNPLVHSEMVEDVIDFFRKEDCDFASSVTTEFPHAPKEMPKFPIGLRVQVMTMACLEKCEELAASDEHREHATKYIFDNPEHFKVAYYPADGKYASMNRPELTFAVNYGANLELDRKIFAEASAEDPDFGMEAIVRTFDAHPEWAHLMGPQKE